MSYVITGRDLQAFRRVCNDLAGLIAGRNDVPAQFHTDVDQAREALESATELSAPTPAATAPAKTVATIPAAPEPETEKTE